jgi:hypothetical protein
MLVLLLLLLTYNKGNLGQPVFQIWGKCSACCPEGYHKDAINYHDSYHVSNGQVCSLRLLIQKW